MILINVQFCKITAVRTVTRRLSEVVCYDQNITADPYVFFLTRYGLENSGFDAQWRQEILLFSISVQSGPEAHPTSSTRGTGALSRA
jgi:hypothetical protein